MDRWQPIDTAPMDTLGVAVYARLTCSCAGHEGGRLVMTAARQDGQWWLPFDHAVELTHWAELPPLPEDEPLH